MARHFRSASSASWESTVNGRPAVTIGSRLVSGGMRGAASGSVAASATWIAPLPSGREKRTVKFGWMVWAPPLS